MAARLRPPRRSGNPAGELGVDTLDGLTGLVEHSLLVHREGADGALRFSMLETIRQFAAEQLAASGEAETLRERHAAFFLSLVQAAAPSPAYRFIDEAMAPRIEAEQPNLRAALAWGIQRGDGELSVGLAGIMGKFWAESGSLSEARDWLDKALALADAASPAARAQALGSRSHLFFQRGELHEAAATSEDALPLFREIGDVAGIADRLDALGAIATQLGELARARALIEESITLWRSADDILGLATALNQLGAVAHIQGDFAAARAAGEEELALARKLDTRRLTALALRQLGRLAIRQREPARARTLLAESVAIWRAQDNAYQTATTLVDLVEVALESGDGAALLVAAEEGTTIWRAFGVDFFAAGMELLLGYGARLNGDDQRALRHFLAGGSALQALQGVGRDGTRALAIAAIAGQALARGRAARGARLLGAVGPVEALRPMRPLQPAIRAAIACDLTAARAALGAAAFAAAWAEGSVLSIDEAMVEALDLAQELATVPVAVHVSRQRDRSDGLSAREVEVLRLIAAGKSTREIAEALSIAEGTVERHVTNLYSKIGVRNRAEAAAYALRNRLVE